MAADSPYIAFFSYSRFDAHHSGDWLSGFRARLENELSAQTGKPIQIFQDVEDITWGEKWRKAIFASLDKAVFLIPAITPHYFDSTACREELEQFVNREEKATFDRFILPLYLISCAELDDTFTRSADRLARVVADHQYEDLRTLRNHPLDSLLIKDKIVSLATSLLKRFREYQKHLLSASELSGTILIPRESAEVTSRTVAAGELNALSAPLDCWVVVEVGNKWHPQIHVRGEHHWRGFLRIGRKEKNADDGVKFTVHLVATTHDVANVFQRYLNDAQKRSKWTGLTKPSEVRILATRQVTKHDAVSNFTFLDGSYSECDASGNHTGGEVTIRTEVNHLTCEARNATGQVEWVSEIDIDEDTALTGSGTYRDSRRDDRGEHHVTIQYPFANLKVRGKPTSSPNAGEFVTLWKKR